MIEIFNSEKAKTFPFLSFSWPANIHHDNTQPADYENEHMSCVTLNVF